MQEDEMRKQIRKITTKTYVYSQQVADDVEETMKLIKQYSKDYAQEQQKALIDRIEKKVIGNKSHTATKMYNIEGTPWIAETVKEKAVNKKIAEQRTKLNQIRSEM